jgi:hypothetical protein
MSQYRRAMYSSYMRHSYGCNKHTHCRRSKLFYVYIALKCAGWTWMNRRTLVGIRTNG